MSKEPQGAQGGLETPDTTQAGGNQVDTRCGMCGSTAIDHTELACRQNRGVYLPIDVFGQGTPLRTSACMHDNCPQCHGTGRGPMGACIHMMSCPCPKCSPIMTMKVTT